MMEVTKVQLRRSDRTEMTLGLLSQDTQKWSATGWLTLSHFLSQFAVSATS